MFKSKCLFVVFKFVPIYDNITNKLTFPEHNLPILNKKFNGIPLNKLLVNEKIDEFLKHYILAVKEGICIQNEEDIYFNDVLFC